MLVRSAVAYRYTSTVENDSAVGTVQRSLKPSDAGAAFSLAMLWFVIPWKELLYPGTNGYLLADPPPVLEHWAIFTNVLILTLVFLLLIWMSSALSRRWLRVVSMLTFSVAAILAFAPLSAEFINWFSPETKRLAGAPLPAVVMAGSAIACATRELSLWRFIKNLKTIAIFFLPFCLIVLLKSSYAQFVREDPALAPVSIERPVLGYEKKLNKRVVWIILDELDSGALEAGRKMGVETGELDRLSSNSFVAHNAHSPSDNTLVSIPALLTGKLIQKAKAVSPNDLNLLAEGDSYFSVHDTSNIFTELKSIGGQAGIVGWYHPYPRIFKDDVAFCYWKPRVSRQCSNVSDLFKCVEWIWSRPASVLPVVSRIVTAPYRLGSIDENGDEQTVRSEYLESKSEELLSNPNLNLVFLHFSLPHAPYLTRAGRIGASYFTNIEVADDVLRKVRETLEKAGQSESTTLIVSSDHPWREKRISQKEIASVPEELRQKLKDDQRIPFIVRLPGQSEHLDYDVEINTVVTKQLIIEILLDKVRTPSDLKQWFDRLDPQSTGADGAG